MARQNAAPRQATVPTPPIQERNVPEQPKPEEQHLSFSEREAQRDQQLEAEAATRQIDTRIFQRKEIGKSFRGWCLFRAKRRCFVEGILIEEPGWEIALSPVAALRVKGNRHLQLIAGVWPEATEEIIRDLYGDPMYKQDEHGKAIPQTRLVLKDEQLKDMDGDPVIRRVYSPDDEQQQLRGMMGKAIGAGSRPEHFHPGWAPKEPAA